MAFGIGPVLTMGAVEALAAHGSDELRQTYLAKLTSGEWMGTMQLTEPQAGSDVGALRTKAQRAGDGTYRITGQKIFITYGEHDFTDNIIHLVLARTPDAPAGTKGISCFIVPKFLVGDDGSLGERNDVQCVSIEHKMGIKVSNTCEVTFGDTSIGNGEPARGYLLGEVHDGIAQMFQVIENARMMVGTKAIATLSTGYLNALDYAKSRVQGADLTQASDKTAPRVTITHHPDVRRSLMTQKSFAEAMRALVLYTATWQDKVMQAEHDGETGDDTELAAAVKTMWSAPVIATDPAIPSQPYSGTTEPGSPDGGTAVQEDPDRPAFAGNGPNDYVCVECGNVLAAAMDPMYMTKKVRVKCGRCKTVNVSIETPEVEAAMRHRRRG